MVRDQDHHHARSDGYVLEHILVAGTMLGRPLLPAEVVHHKNRNRQDNTPSNLLICASQAEHAHIHRAMRSKENATLLAEMQKLRDEGLTYKAISERLGCSLQTVWQRVRDGKNNGSTVHGAAIGTAKLSTDNVRRICSLRSEGASVKTIATRFGVSVDTIYAIITGKSWRAETGKVVRL